MSSLLSDLKPTVRMTKVSIEPNAGSPSLGSVSASVSPEPPDNASSAAKLPSSSNPMTFLVVDDAKSVRKILVHMLTKRFGHKTAEAENGQEAVDMVRASLAAGEPFDAVFLDCMMPVLDGPSAVTQMKAMGFVGKIVGFTDASSEAARKFVSVGVTTILEKPLLPVVVAKIVKGALDDYFVLTSRYPLAYMRN